MRKILSIIVSILTLAVMPVFVSAQRESHAVDKLIVFYSPACHKCEEIKREVMPKIEEEFKGRLLIEYRDISDIENYKLMLGLQEKQAAKIKNTLPVFYFAGRFLSGEGEIAAKLRRLIESSLGAPPEAKQNLAEADLTARFKSFRPLAIISAGLVDGINPCAFTVIVFFISFLALQGYRKRELTVIGLSFILTVFLTYLLIGLGLFGFLYRLRGFWVLVKWFNIAVGFFSLILGILCVYDIFKFKQSGKTEGLILQLPQSIKNQIHKIIGWHYRLEGAGRAPEGRALKKHLFRLFLSALITGFLVSILEAVCTGQMYLPTIAFVLKTTPLKFEAFGYLLLYNLMFAAPLLIIFILALWGVTSEQFSGFLKQHLLKLKVAMAILFFALGSFLIWRA